MAENEEESRQNTTALTGSAKAVVRERMGKRKIDSADKEYVHYYLVVHEKGGSQTKFPLHLRGKSADSISIIAWGWIGMEDLIREYREALRRIRKSKRKYPPVEKRNDEEVYKYRLLEEMERDLEWSLEWMETGRQPGNRRGVERLAAYQRERPIDPIHFQRYAVQPLYGQEEHTLSNEDMRRVEEALSLLSPLEREVYIMSRGKGLSYREIAGLLGVAKGTVQKMIERAEKKMAQQKETSLFLVG